MDLELIMTELVQPATFILVSVIGWGVRAIWGKVCDFDKKIDNLRAEMHAELQEYERKETCRAHREAIIHKIESIMSLASACPQKQGMLNQQLAVSEITDKCKK